MSGIFRGSGTGGSGGDVVGPESSTDNAIARFSGTTGKLLDETAALLDNDGNTILPNMPRFTYFYGSPASGVTGDGTPYTLLFPTQSVDVGGDFNSSTGVFTVPHSGAYGGIVVLEISGLTSSHTNLSLDAVSSVTGVTNLFLLNPFAISVSGALTLSVGQFNLFTAAETSSMRLTVSGGTQDVNVDPVTLRSVAMVYRTS